MKTFGQFLEETVKHAPGSFEHFKHHVQAAGKAEEHDDHEATWKHHDELQKHYKPAGSYSRGTGLLDVDFGDHKSSDAELRRHYAKTVAPKSAAAKKSYK